MKIKCDPYPRKDKSLIPHLLVVFYEGEYLILFTKISELLHAVCVLEGLS